MAVAWVEVAEVADLKRKEYRNDIRQLAPLRKPIEDCDKTRVYAERGGGCRIKGIPIFVGGHLHGVRMVATAVLPPPVYPDLVQEQSGSHPTGVLHNSW